VTLQERVAQLVAHHGDLRKAARAIQIEPSYLSRLGSGEKQNPGAVTLKRLGLRKIVSYVLRDQKESK